jgi:hypothetical protein
MRAALTYPEAFPEARLKPLTGEVELAIADAAARPGARPERVTRILSAAYATVGGVAASPDLVRRLSSGAREWLAQRLALAFRPDLEWFEAECASCGEAYDIGMALARAPRKPAGAGFPLAEIDTSLGQRVFESPCGWHEEQAACRPGDPIRVFAALTSLSDHAEAEAEAYSARDLALIEATLDDLSPDVADRAAAACPACGAETTARIEPLRFTLPSAATVLGEAHLLAGAYHWPEREILALPPTRRRHYAALIRQGGRRT